MFNDIYLNPSEVKIYGSISGTASGQFIPSEEHPGHILLRNIAALVALFIGVGYAFHSMRGTTNRKIDGGKILSIGQDPLRGLGATTNVTGGTATATPAGGFGTGGTAIVNQAPIQGGAAPSQNATVTTKCWC